MTLFNVTAAVIGNKGSKIKIYLKSNTYDYSKNRAPHRYNNRMIPCLDRDAPFPPLSRALSEPNGLLAAGGELSAVRLLDAYKNGIFPWYSDDQPLLWWSPDPRMVLVPSELKISRSLRKRLRRGGKGNDG